MFCLLALLVVALAAVLRRCACAEPCAADQDAEADLYADARLDADVYCVRDDRAGRQATTEPAATDAQPEATTAAPTRRLQRVRPTQRTPTAAGPEETRLTASQNVNVRSGPGTAYPAIGRLTTGQSFEVTGRNDAGDWVKFDFNGQDGWVTAALVTVAGDLNVRQGRPGAGDSHPAAAADGTPAAARSRPPRLSRPTRLRRPHPQYPIPYMQGSANCQPNAGTHLLQRLRPLPDNNLRERRVRAHRLLRPPADEVQRLRWRRRRRLGLLAVRRRVSRRRAPLWKST